MKRKNSIRKKHTLKELETKDTRYISTSENGVYFKDLSVLDEEQIFKKDIAEDRVIYLGEFDLSQLLSFNGESFDMNEAREKAIGETYGDLKRLCHDNEADMLYIFETVDWQYFSTLYNEME